MEIDQQTKADLKETLEQYVQFLNKGAEEVIPEIVTTITPQGYVLALQQGLCEDEEYINALIGAIFFGMYVTGKDINVFLDMSAEEVVTLLKSLYFEEKEGE